MILQLCKDLDFSDLEEVKIGLEDSRLKIEGEDFCESCLKTLLDRKEGLLSDQTLWRICEIALMCIDLSTSMK